MMRSERNHARGKNSSWLGNVCNWSSSIILDPRQILAGFLTVLMFVMLAHMIKRDHFDTQPQVKISSTDQKVQLEGANFEEEAAGSLASDDDQWTDSTHELKPCWKKPISLEDTFQTEGYVTFSLTDGPEYHVSQIADAVVVARSLGATLVLPDIRGSKVGDKRDFDEVYDADKFIKSLEGVIRVVKEQPSTLSASNLAIVKVPNRVTEDHISAHIEPIYREKGNIRIVTQFQSVNMKKAKDRNDGDSVACLAMFGTLELLSEVRGVVDSMIERLQTLSRKSDGQFLAVDLRVDVLEKGCQGKDGSRSKTCYDAKEIAEFLRKIGYNKDTTIYLTQSRWDNKLDALKRFFPKTYTKESIIPMEYKQQYLDLDAPSLEEVIDFYISSESDVFVPAISGLFYANVAGKRIATGKTQILVPADISSSSASPGKYISHYITKKNHLAYSCFC